MQKELFVRSHKSGSFCSCTRKGSIIRWKYQRNGILIYAAAPPGAFLLQSRWYPADAMECVVKISWILCKVWKWLSLWYAAGAVSAGCAFESCFWCYRGSFKNDGANGVIHKFTHYFGHSSLFMTVPSRPIWWSPPCSNSPYITIKAEIKKFHQYHLLEAQALTDGLISDNRALASYTLDHLIHIPLGSATHSQFSKMNGIEGFFFLLFHTTLSPIRGVIVV